MQREIRIVDDSGHEMFTTTQLAQRLNIRYGNAYMRYRYHGHTFGYVPQKISGRLYWAKAENLMTLEVKNAVD